MCLKGKLGYKGERGFSAYEIAVQNGFKGTEQDWLATLGTSSHFQQNKVTHTTIAANETIFDLPTAYTSSSFADVYVEGERLNSDEYTIDSTTNKVILTTPLEVIGTKVEIVMITMSTNNLPIVDTINSESTNDTAPGTKATYDFVKEEVNDLKTIIDGKFALITGTNPCTSMMCPINYPSGFNQTNSIIIGFMIGNNSAFHTLTNIPQDSTASVENPKTPFAMLNPNVITIYDTTNYVTRTSYDFKILLMKVGEENE